MDKLFTALAAFAAGLAVSYVNYRITLNAFKSDKGYALFPLRALVSALFITALFILGRQTELDLVWLLIGGAAGSTLGLVLYTLFLSKKREQGEDTDLTDIN